MTFAISPMEVTDANLTSSTVPEADHAEWNGGTSYVLDDRVIVLATHAIYQANGPTTNDYPPDNLGTEEAPGVWTLISATNRWKAFDRNTNRAVSQDAGWEYEFTLDKRVTALTLHGLSVASASVVVTDQTIPRRNLLTYTEDVENAAWSKVSPTTVDNDATTAPDGTLTGMAVIAGTTGADVIPRIQQNCYTANGEVSVSLFLKAGTTSDLIVRLNHDDDPGTTGRTTIRLDLSVGTVTLSEGAASVTLTEKNDGWWHLKFTRDANTYVQSVIEIRTALFVPQDGSESFYFWHPQVEAGRSHTDYQSVADAATFDKTTFSETRDVADFENVFDFMSWWLWEPEPDPELLFNDFLANSGNTLTVSGTTSPGTDAKVSQITLGTEFKLGDALAETEITFEDFSSIERDQDFGDIDIVERDFVREAIYRVAINVGDERRVINFVAGVRTRPTSWYLDPDLIDRAGIIFGIPAGPARIPLSQGGVSIATVEVEGM